MQSVSWEGCQCSTSGRMRQPEHVRGREHATIIFTPPHAHLALLRIGTAAVASWHAYTNTTQVPQTRTPLDDVTFLGWQQQSRKVKVLTTWWRGVSLLPEVMWSYWRCCENTAREYVRAGRVRGGRSARLWRRDCGRYGRGPRPPPPPPPALTARYG